MDLSADGLVLACVGSALSGQIRAEVLLVLSVKPEYPAVLAQRCGTSRQNMSNHLAFLRGAGLIRAVSEGKNSGMN